MPCVVVPGAVPLAIEPHGRPIASVRPLLFNELVVDGLVLGVQAADGFDDEGAVVDVPVDPLVPVEPLIPAEPLLVPDDAPAPPEAPPLAPPPAPAASATPALPASRIAAINEIE